MKKEVVKPGRTKTIVLTVLAVLFVVFIVLPLIFSVFTSGKFGNVALIPIKGVITGDGAAGFGQSGVSSRDIVRFIEQADQNPSVKVILLEINSPGGSAVASDEIASTVKKAQKPVIAVIREVGASGGYWVASATDHVIANKMSITGSIGVISSYLEFSGLMQKYGVGYERLVSGDNKDIGTPFQKLSEEQRKILQQKINKIHNFFVEEIAQNRDLEKSEVQRLATGEFYLGAEALELGLVDQLGDVSTAEEYIKKVYGLEKVGYVPYEKKAGFLELLAGVFNDFSFHIGEGMGSILLQRDYSPIRLM